jgi:hypothetical protein
MRIKAGVQLDGVHFMLWYAAALADWVRQYLGYGEATLTGGREPADYFGPARVRATLHPGGYALDFRTNDLPGGSLGDAAQQWAGTLAAALRPAGFDVVLERDHVHIEYQPPVQA